PRQASSNSGVSRSAGASGWSRSSLAASAELFMLPAADDLRAAQFVGWRREGCRRRDGRDRSRDQGTGSFDRTAYRDRYQAALRRGDRSVAESGEAGCERLWEWASRMSLILAGAEVRARLAPAGSHQRTAFLQLPTGQLVHTGLLMAPPNSRLEFAPDTTGR